MLGERNDTERERIEEFWGWRNLGRFEWKCWGIHLPSKTREKPAISITTLFLLFPFSIFHFLNSNKYGSPTRVDCLRLPCPFVNMQPLPQLLSFSFHICLNFMTSTKAWLVIVLYEPLCKCSCGSPTRSYLPYECVRFHDLLLLSYLIILCNGQ